MKTKRNSHCLSQAIPPIKSWLHSNRLSCLVLATSLLPIASQQVNAAPEWNQNQNIQSTQNNKVTYQGTVIDENGEPLPGVNITYKNANGVGVITDIDGKFSIAIPQNIHSLIFSYVGMKRPYGFPVRRKRSKSVWNRMRFLCRKQLSPVSTPEKQRVSPVLWPLIRKKT